MYRSRMSLRIYNTLSRQKEDFTPQDPKKVTLYVCGPTVYNYAHIGNARPAVVFDLLYRLLRQQFGDNHVIYARNITDVDDKINKAAAEQNVPISTITEKFADIYRADMAALNVARPNIEPKATDHIDQIISMIERLIENGHAYAADGHVLFDVNSYKDYGALSRRSLDEMIAGARVEVAPYKKNAHDFVLWKPSPTDDLPGWNSPWGRGRPGWHIECSAMIERHLGETIDIHCGGQDLIFPHHENEVAQSTCAHNGKMFVRYWMHNGFLSMDKTKMSKSLGNVLLVHDLLKDWNGETIRLALLSAQYRQPLEWNDDLLSRSETILNKLQRVIDDLAHIDAQPAYSEKFLAALHDDLNTPMALAEMIAISKDKTLSPEQKKAYLLGCGALFGLFEQASSAKSDIDANSIEALITERNQARANKNFARADEIRDELLEKNIILEDKADGTLWRVG